MKTNKTAFVAMAFGKATVSTEGSSDIKRYIGIGSSFVLGVNPTKAELESIYDRTIENEPVYIGEQDNNGTKVPYVRLDFIVATDPSVCSDIAIKTKLSFFLRKEYRFNRDKTKVQVIDKYGRTCWVTTEEAKNHAIPQYSNGPANIDKDYRPAFVGEEDLTNFIKTYLCIGNVMEYKNGVWVLKENTEDYMCRLDNISSYFTGDVSEVKNAIALMPKNKIKLMYGVRKADDGKTYQAIYTQMTLRNGVTNYDRIAKDLKERKSAGAYPTTEFEACDIKEYSVAPTTFTAPTSNDNPFEMPLEDQTPWEY